MSRYKSLLTKEQIKFIIDNPSMSNKDFAEMFNVKNSIIAQYKSRLRKIGVDIPLMKRDGLISKATKDHE